MFGEGFTVLPKKRERDSGVVQGWRFPAAASCFDDDAIFVEKTHSFAM